MSEMCQNDFFRNPHFVSKRLLRTPEKIRAKDGERYEGERHDEKEFSDTERKTLIEKILKLRGILTE